jgi:hypothetical protein
MTLKREDVMAKLLFDCISPRVLRRTGVCGNEIHTRANYNNHTGREWRLSGLHPAADHLRATATASGSKQLGLHNPS